MVGRKREICPKKSPDFSTNGAAHVNKSTPGEWRRSLNMLFVGEREREREGGAKQARRKEEDRLKSSISSQDSSREGSKP